MTGQPRSATYIFSKLLGPLICLLVVHLIIAAQNPVLIDFTSREDFQGDGLGQWASYPPAQDIGYEPSITPTRDLDAPGGRALMRWVQPNRAGDLRFGFIKKVDLVTNAAGRIAFDYRI